MDYQCRQCRAPFSTEADLQNHIECLKAHLKVFCKHCSTFIRLEEGKFHKDITYSCTICKRILRENLCLTHKCFHAQTYQDSAITMKLPCSICEEPFFSQKDINDHIRDKHTTLHTTVCKCCKKELPERDKCAAHFQTVHGVSYPLLYNDVLQELWQKQNKAINLEKFLVVCKWCWCYGCLKEDWKTPPDCEK